MDALDLPKNKPYLQTTHPCLAQIIGNTKTHGNEIYQDFIKPGRTHNYEFVINKIHLCNYKYAKLANKEL